MIKKRKIRNTDLEVSELGMGTAPIGGWPVVVSPDQAHGTLNAAWENGIRYFDTAPLYGSGMAEERLGQFYQHFILIKAAPKGLNRFFFFQFYHRFNGTFFSLT